MVFKIFFFATRQIMFGRGRCLYGLDMVIFADLITEQQS